MAWVNPTAIDADYRTVLLKEQPGGLAYALCATDGANNLPGFDAAGRNGPAAIDLLTVLAHEMGHALGLEHEDEGLMAEVLPIGLHRFREPAALDEALLDFLVGSCEGE